MIYYIRQLYKIQYPVLYSFIRYGHNLFMEGGPGKAATNLWKLYPKAEPKTTSLSNSSVINTKDTHDCWPLERLCCSTEFVALRVLVRNEALMPGSLRLNTPELEAPLFVSLGVWIPLEASRLLETSTTSEIPFISWNSPAWNILDSECMKK